MYALVVSYHVPPENVDELTHYARAMTSSIEPHDGFKQVTLLVDSKTGKMVSMSFWETKAAMMAYKNHNIRQEWVVHIVPSLTAPTIVETFEVV